MQTSTVGGEGALLWAEGLTQSWDGVKYQFKGVDFVLTRGERAGLVGSNGCGKSTLLRVLAGKDDPDGGKVQFRKGIVTAYVEQEPEFGEGSTLSSVMYAGASPVMQALREYDTATSDYQKIAAEKGSEDQATQKALSRFERATSAMETQNAWDAEALCQRMIDQLLPQYQDKLDAPTALMSGGEKKRIAIASALLQKPDLLLMDEPTNHLDVKAIEWLEKELVDKSTCLLLVTHDRYFLETTCSFIFELDSSSLYKHTGSYSNFLEAKAVREAELSAQIDVAKKQAKKELEWVRRMPSARQAKSKSRVARYYELEKFSKSGKKSSAADNLSLSQGKSKRLGGVVMELDSVNLQVEERGGDDGAMRLLLDDFSYEFSKGDRVGIVGGNGVGKSTFIKLLSGLQAPTSGEIKVGDTVVIGHYEQQGLDLPGDMSVLDYVINSGALGDGGMTSRELAAYSASGGVTALSSGDGGSAAKVDAFELIKRFGFERSRAFEKIGSLSGGERRRLQLLGVLAKRPNVLLLDEPTNDLDLNTLNVLERYILDDYDGVLIVVGHDRAFLDAVTSHLFVFEGDGVVRNFEGSFSDFVEFDKQREKEKSSSATLDRKSAAASAPTLAAAPSKQDLGFSATAGVAEPAAAKKAVKMNNKERMEWKGLQGKIDKLSKKRGELDSKLAKGDGDYEVLTTMTEELAAVNNEIEEKEMRWLELAEAFPEETAASR